MSFAHVASLETMEAVEACQKEWRKGDLLLIPSIKLLELLK